MCKEKGIIEPTTKKKNINNIARENIMCKIRKRKREGEIQREIHRNTSSYGIIIPSGEPIRTDYL